MLSSDRNPFKRLSALEARRALYIDFEGEKDKPPILLGVLRRPGRGTEPNVHQDVVDRDFELFGPNAREFRDAVEVVVVRAEHGDRRIVSWSEHDLEVVRRLRGDEPRLVARFERRYVNALGLARRWAKVLHPEDRPANGKLAGYLALVDYEVPPGGGPGRVGKTIRALRPTLRGGRSLTPGQQRHWDELLEHNRHDCAGMRAVCLRAARELESAGLRLASKPGPSSPSVWPTRRSGNHRRLTRPHPAVVSIPRGPCHRRVRQADQHRPVQLH